MKMITVNKLTGLEKAERLLGYIHKWINGWLELSEEVLKEINHLMESEAIIYEEIFNLLKRFDCTDAEASHYASLRIDEARDMQADWDLKVMLAKLWEEK